MDRPRFAIQLGVVSFALGALATMAIPNGATPARWDVSLPHAFEANEGQADPAFDFVSRVGGTALLIAPTQVALSELRIRLRGANPSATKGALHRQPGAIHYLRGNPPSRRHRAIAAYGVVSYGSVYRGVDVRYYWNRGHLEYDFIVAPGADPSAIGFEFDGVERLQIDQHGSLLLHTASKTAARFQAPVVFQEHNGRRAPVDGAYALVEGRRVAFRIGRYDRTRPLVIDPAFAFSTRLGGAGNERGYSVALDQAGNIYVTGDAASVDFPRQSAMQSSLRGSTDVFITKLTPSGQLVYSTFLGGSGADVGYGIAVDRLGNAYVTGDTQSPDYPLVRPLQKTLGGTSDVFVSKVSADGSTLLYSTYVGGSNGERGFGVAVDTGGAAYVAGYTNSQNFPTANPIQATFGGGDADAIVFKVTPSGAALAYSTYLGGQEVRPDLATSIAVDLEGSAYVAGFTNSADFPTVRPLQPFRGPTDAFVARFTPSGSALVYATHLGGRADDEGQGIAIDAAGNAYVVGHTESPDFPATAGAYSTECVSVHVAIAIGDICSGGDAFITKITADGTAMAYSTYINGRRFESGRSIAVDSDGSAYITGFTGSSDFLAVRAPQKAFGGGEMDAFVVKVTRAGSALAYSTYLGGSGEDGGYGIAVDRGGSAYVTGFTGSPDFPARSSLTRSKHGQATDAFVTIVSP